MSAESLRGLTPEQVYNLANVDTQRERLRQSSVENIIGGANIESQIAERAAQQETVPVDFEGQTYNIPTRTMGTYLGGLQQRLAMNDYRQTQREIAAANRKENQQAAAEKERVRVGERQQDKAVAAANHAESMGIQWQSLNASNRNRYIDNTRQAQESEQRAAKDERSRRLELGATEAKIVGTKPEYLESAAPLMDFFNSESDGRYIWMHFPDISRGFMGITAFSKIDAKYDNANTRVEIPPTKSGVPVTAKNIYDAAVANNMTVREYMEKIYFPHKVGRPAPWPLQE